MATKITAPNGRYSIIDSRSSELATKFADNISSQSSTEAQPWVGVNFNADGAVIGGRTMGESLRTATIKKCRDAGMVVEEI